MQKRNEERKNKAEERSFIKYDESSWLKTYKKGKRAREMDKMNEKMDKNSNSKA